jgi:hypothetical protein
MAGCNDLTLHHSIGPWKDERMRHDHIWSHRKIGKLTCEYIKSELDSYEIFKYVFEVALSLQIWVITMKIQDKTTYDKHKYDNR